MKISKKRGDRLYGVIADTIFAARLRLAKDDLTKEEIDLLLFNMETNMYRRVCNVLNIKED